MDAIVIPFLPTSLWIMTSGLILLVLLVTVALYAYYQKRVLAVTKESGDVASLAAAKEQLQADVNALRSWIEKNKGELEKISGERQEQEKLRVELAELERGCAEKDRENQELRNEVGTLENQKVLIEQTVRQLREEEKKIQEKLAAAEAALESLGGVQAELATVESKLKEIKEEIKNDRGILEETKVQIDALRFEKERLEKNTETLAEDINALRDSKLAVDEEAKKAKIALDDIKAELDQMRMDKDKLDNNIQKLHFEITNLERYKNELNCIVDDLEKNKEEAIELKNDKKRLEDEVDEKNKELSSQRNELARLEVKIGANRYEEGRLKEEIDRMQKELGGKVPEKEGEDIERHYADLIHKIPRCISKEEFQDSYSLEKDEITYLNELYSQLLNRNIYFPRRVIDAFHTSLKCHDINPLTVLAGVSGTGKTLLPIEYARTMGMHSLVIAVQPRWDSPQDLFGFYNYLEKEYKATELSRALLRFDPYNFNDEKFNNMKWDWVRDRMLLVLIDEMNLARTEYYFSEFLSKLELRRMVEDEQSSSDRQKAQIELDTGAVKDTRFMLWVPKNVMFVGTMNEDETTQSLSDKVIDRANVLRFGKPDYSNRPQRHYEDAHPVNHSQNYLPFEKWKEWIRDYGEQEPWSRDVMGWIHEINVALDKVGRPFGYRVESAIAKYVANYPQVEAGRHKLAFADQIEQKIIPKLRGIDLNASSANECMDELERIIGALDDDELGAAFRLSREQSRDLGMFQWRGVSRKLNGA